MSQFRCLETMYCVLCVGLRHCRMVTDIKQREGAGDGDEDGDGESEDGRQQNMHDRARTSNKFSTSLLSSLGPRKAEEAYRSDTVIGSVLKTYCTEPAVSPQGAHPASLKQGAVWEPWKPWKPCRSIFEVPWKPHTRHDWFHDRGFPG